MDEFTISLPPCPNANCGAHSLYLKLEELRVWALEALDSLEPVVPPKVFAKLKPPGNLAPEERWDMVSVADKYLTLVYMREIRTAWDAMLMDYEDAYNATGAVKSRYATVQRALYVLAQAVVDPETREAMQATMDKRMKRQYALVMNKMQKLLNVDDADNDSDSNDEHDDWCA